MKRSVTASFPSSSQCPSSSTSRSSTSSSRCHASWCPSSPELGSWQVQQRQQCQPERSPWLYMRQSREQQQRRQGASSKLSFWRAVWGRLFVRARALVLCQERAAVNLPQEVTLSRDDAPCR